MPSAESGYMFPVLKEQKESMIPTLSLDMDPSVISISLDQQQVTLYPRGSLKLRARVESKNGASRDVKWVSSNPTAVHVTDDGTVAVHKDAAAGTYKVTAVSQFDESKQADCEITVDNREYTVSIAREDTKNSPNAEIGVYWSREDAEGASNASPVAEGKGTTDSLITFKAKAGSEIYLKFKDLAEKDVVNKITVTDKDGKTFEAKLCSIDPFIGHFTMPCGDAKIEVKYATDITYYQYTWFVGQDWSTWERQRPTQLQAGETVIMSDLLKLQISSMVNCLMILLSREYPDIREPRSFRRKYLIKLLSHKMERTMWIIQQNIQPYTYILTDLE